MKTSSPTPPTRCSSRPCLAGKLIPTMFVLWLLAFPYAVSAADRDSSPAVSGPDELPWQTLFGGTSLAGWKVTDFAGAGEVTLKDDTIRLAMGALLTGVVYTNPLPKIDYEVSLKAMKLAGNDFFCGLTFPVQDSFCTLILGGWGGGLVGLSSLDNYDASENESTTFRNFEKNRWYAIRLRVTRAKIEAWLDGEQLIDVSIVGRKISLRPGEIEMSVPFGVATYQTSAALRDIYLRPLEPAPKAAETAPPKS